MKALRFSLIKLPGRVLNHARELIIGLAKDHPCFDVLVAARKKIMLLQPVCTHPLFIAGNEGLIIK